MESVEKPQLENIQVEDVKSSIICDENDKSDATRVASDVCHKSNGVAEVANSEDKTSVSSSDVVDNQVIDTVVSGDDVTEKNISALVKAPIVSPESSTTVEITENSAETMEVLESELETCTKESEELLVVPVIETDKDLKNEGKQEVVIEIDIVEPMIPVTFETEIVVENNDNFHEKVDEEEVADHPNDLINELGESIELSEALRSSDSTYNIENNNCAVKQEMFNKEELLNILEGNDVESESEKDIPKLGRSESQILESQLALQQLSRLKRSKKPKLTDRQPKRRKSEKIVIPKKVAEVKKEDENKKDGEDKIVDKMKEDMVETEENKEVCIVKALVKDWDDEEAVDDIDATKIVKEDESLLNNSADAIKSDQDATKESLDGTTTDSPVIDAQSTNTTKSGDEVIPQRRLGRIIKKKVIFDPDNPDTFTKGKIITKNKEAHTEKDLSVLHNKNKNDVSFQRSKSKSPLSKLQWKKPPPKNSKQYRRLTEVDKLLMDEGAVNMIYQLTPEAGKGKKNMKTKAEFIKKIQSSTPDSKEMKFRERKKEIKCEEGEAKKIIVGKHRISLSSSVKSPSVCEDFEAHSADDSIIYRRHSSSSYSSSCMSPHRLSDLEVGQVNNTGESIEIIETQIVTDEIQTEVFMGDKRTPNEIINKDDCMSIKEKLNSKLSLALNKRKRDSHRTDKPHKQKKTVKTDDNVISTEDATVFNYLTLTIDQNLAELCIKKTGFMYNIEAVKEIEKALLYIDSRDDISVTLLRSECGTFCSGVDLKPLLIDDLESKAKYASAIADLLRSLFCALEQHRKLLCIGVEGSCSGVGLALVALSDITLASEQASFFIDSYNTHTQAIGGPLLPGIAALTHSHLPQSLINNLVLFGSRLSASDALQSGLVSRILWPDSYLDQLRAITKGIAAQSKQNILLKKQLLNLKKEEKRESFNSNLEKERDMLIEYWISVEGQEMIRSVYKTA